MGVKIANLESIDAAAIEKLEATGITSSDDLLGRASQKEGRSALTASTGLSDELLCRLLRMADLVRITGVTELHAQLLDALGIGTAAALAEQDASVLIKQMRRKNVELLIVRGMPPESTVARWIADAKALPAISVD